jgi:hypothetical protein
MILVALVVIAFAAGVAAGLVLHRRRTRVRVPDYFPAEWAQPARRARGHDQTHADG